MLFRGFLAGFLLLWSASAGFCAGKDNGDLWLIEQDFVKFGKKDVYEKAKKGLLDGFWDYAQQSSFCGVAQRESDSAQYIYLMPVGDYSGVDDFMMKREGYYGTLSQDTLLPYWSTINFVIKSLHQYLPACSFLPKGKESIMSYAASHFYVLGVKPENGEGFEEELQKIASAQAAARNGVCFRTWKVVMGGDTPKYIVIVYANTITEAEKQGKSLNLTTGAMKLMLRSQKEASAMISQDLSCTRH